MSYRSAQLASVVVGLLLALAVIGASVAVFQTRGLRQDRVRSNADIAAIARRVFKIEQPSPRELSVRIVAALKVCADDKACYAAFRDAAPRGRRGPQGRRGVQGPRGPQGVAGTAAKGIQGERGPQGRTGNSGPTGAKGEPGATGPQGPAGVPVVVCVPSLVKLCPK